MLEFINRATKRAKYNHNDALSCNVPAFSNSTFGDSSIIKIYDDSTIKEISGCKNLTVANLHTTSITKIDNCPTLYSLQLINNEKLTSLVLPSVQLINIESAVDLINIDLPTVTTVMLMNLPSVKTINMPIAEHVVLSQLDFEKNGISLKTSIPNVKTLELIGIKGLTSEALAGINASSILINNCDIVNLVNLSNFDNLIVRNCKSLQALHNLINIKNITVIDCPELFNITRLDDIQSIMISKCNSLCRVIKINSTNLTIQYCFELTNIPSLEVHYLTVERCPLIGVIHINPVSYKVVIDHCQGLESVEFDCRTPFCYTDLSIDISGDNQITCIKDWYVSSLTISNNTNLEKITNIYNVVNLNITSCIDLISIKNTFIQKLLSITNCPYLEQILNVYGYNSIYIVDCDVLTDIGTVLTSLSSAVIKNCPDLNIFMVGRDLTTLTLSNTGIILIDDLSHSAVVDIHNSRLLPNMKSSVSQNQAIGCRIENVSPEAIELSEYLQKLSHATSVITSRLRVYSIRMKYLKAIKIRERNRLTNCVICQDDILLVDLTITQCDHCFHKSCLSRWVTIRRTCPLCNSVV